MNDITADRDYLLELSSAVSCYLSLMSAVGECVSIASPEVGGTYKNRIDQLRTRVFFQATPKALKTSLKVLEGELKDYAMVAAQHLDHHDLELRRTTVALENAVDKLAERCAHHSSQLENLAAAIAAPETESASPQLVAQDLRRISEAMNHETATALATVREEIAAAEHRLRGGARTDPSTRLLNAAEITRQMEAYRASGATFSLLSFELLGSVTEPIMRQAAERLEKQFRHRDRVARWAEAEFLVLFQGPEEVAEGRAEQVAKLLAGHYELGSGRKVEISVHAQVLDTEVSMVLSS